MLALGALGVVYGDIGTSPLYALNECFRGDHGLTRTPENVLGILSLVFWSLILVVVVKYLSVVMRADNQGEGGVLALFALVMPSAGANIKRTRRMLLLFGLFGSALLYGDGVITPAITVLSAVEGLETITPGFKPYVIPITLPILIGLFMIQRRGTAGIGKLFGPMMLLWFVMIGAFGLPAILRAPGVLAAVNPWYGIDLSCGTGARLPGAGRGGAGDHRRRGALRRHGPLRAGAHPGPPGTRWCCRRCC